MERPARPPRSRGIRDREHSAAPRQRVRKPRSSRLAISPSSMRTTASIFPPLQDVHNPSDNSPKVFANLEVPDSQHFPTAVTKFSINAAVSRNVPLDLSVPIFTRPTRLMSRGMSMPKGAIHEDSDSASWPSNIRTSRCPLVVAAPTSEAATVERLAQLHLRAGIPALHRGHDPFALLWRSGIRHRSKAESASWRYRARSSALTSSSGTSL